MRGTIAQVVVPATPTLTAVKPEFIRLPKPGSVDPWTGLCRSAINELILPSPRNGNKALVKSCSLRKPGTVKGIRLVCLESLLAYIRQCGEIEAAQ